MAAEQNLKTDGGWPSVSVPRGAEQVRLGELDDDGAGAQLVARVSRVPVIVACVSV